MSMTLTPEQASAPARIELATVVAVNALQYTVDLLTEFTHRQLVDVPVASMYAHKAHAGGMFVMPEVGSQCYAFSCGDGTSFVLGFVVGPGTDPSPNADQATGPGVSFAGKRAPLEPGDTFLGTRDRNHVILRRGGLLEIGATPLAQRVYIPIQNTIRDYFERYEAVSPLGEISWGHPTIALDAPASDATGDTPVLVTYSVKYRAQEDITEGKYTVEVRLGDLSSATLDPELDGEHMFANSALLDETKTTPEDAAGTVSITVYSHMSKKVTYAFQLSREGDCVMKVGGYLHVESDKDAYLRVRKTLTVAFGAAADFLKLTEGGDVKVSAQEVAIHAATGARLRSPLARVDAMGGVITLENASVLTLAASQIVMSAGAAPGSPLPVIRDNGLLNNLATHTHTMTIYLTAPQCAAIVACGAAVAIAPTATVPIPATTLPAASLKTAASAKSAGTTST